MTTTTRNLDLESALNDAEQRFIGRNRKSQDRHEKAKASLPGGNTRTILHYPPFPVALDRGEGCFVWDYDGNRYADFDSNVDEVAAWTIGGLVAGKVLAKAGFFAFVLKFIKPILLLLGAGGMAVWRWFTGRKKEEETAFAEAPPTPETPSEPGDEREKQG